MRSGHSDGKRLLDGATVPGLLPGRYPSGSAEKLQCADQQEMRLVSISMLGFGKLVDQRPVTLDRALPGMRI